MSTEINQDPSLLTNYLATHREERLREDRIRAVRQQEV
jgi:hypothetical protein